VNKSKSSVNDTWISGNTSSNNVNDSVKGQERVKVYVRVRPAFSHEVRQDENALTFRN
jgi:hypothetical protein